MPIFAATFLAAAALVFVPTAVAFAAALIAFATVLATALAVVVIAVMRAALTGLYADAAIIAILETATK